VGVLKYAHTRGGIYYGKYDRHWADG
jgi:hypothetical protein